MNMFSSFALYCVLLLCYSSGRCVNGTADSKSRDGGQQTVRNGTVAAETPPLSAAERVRRLIPYVTYYMVGTSDDNDLAQFRQQQNRNPSSTTVRPPLQQVTADPDYFGQSNYDAVAGAGQPHADSPPKQHYHYQQQQQQQQQKQGQYYRQYPDYAYRPPPQHLTPSEYLRFPSSQKTRRPIVIATSPAPLYEVDTEQQSYVYTARPQPQYTSPSPRPSAVPHYEYGGFLPTAPPPEHHQQVVYYTTTAKTKKLKPKNKRPTTTPTTTTRLPALTLPALPPPPQPPPPVVSTDKYGALNDLLEGYDLGGRLSNKITADNIDSNIQTLSAVLQILQKEAEQPQYIPKVPKLKTTTYKPYHQPHDDYDDTGDVGNPGRPGVDYPILSVIPKTNFDCKTQRYKGFFGDPDTHCQVWHYCDLNGGQASFLCPNGTIFNQVTLTCDWWFNVKCDTTAQLYVLNERLYKYIIPSKPSFPEDFEGPLVDRYLEERFRETENKRTPQKENASEMMMMNTVMMLTTNTTTVEPDTVRTPYQQLLDVDTKR